MRGKITASLITFCFVFGVSLTIRASDESQKLMEPILSLAISKGGIELIKTIEATNSLPDKEAIELYLALTDYYLGEGASEILTQRITEFGNNILPFLIKEKHEEVKCLDQYKSICNSLDSKKTFIDVAIDEIRKGNVFYPVFPDNLVEEALRRIKIVNIFVEDYKFNLGNFPLDLNVLQSYAWEKYKYKLIIYNPWGELFNYNIVNGGQGFSIQFGEGGPEE